MKYQILKEIYIDCNADGADNDVVLAYGRRSESREEFVKVIISLVDEGLLGKRKTNSISFASMDIAPDGIYLTAKGMRKARTL